jgi:hypothetical protein
LILITFGLKVKCQRISKAMTALHLYSSSLLLPSSHISSGEWPPCPRNLISVPSEFVYTVSPPYNVLLSPYLSGNSFFLLSLLRINSPMMSRL